jgi:hypothetical protein
MILHDLRDFEKLIKICKKHGINTMSIGDIKFTLPNSPAERIESISKDFPEQIVTVPRYNGPDLGPDKIDTDELTDEQRLFYSAKEEPGAEQ